jgi:hypothetical protein
VNTVPGVFRAEALLQQVAVVPDYKLGEGHFLVNDLINIAPVELMTARITAPA